MKKFNVYCNIDKKEMFEGRAPHDGILYDACPDFVEAESEEEAIDLVKDWIMENLHGGCHAERTENEIIIYDEDDKVVECNYNFTAKQEE